MAEGKEPNVMSTQDARQAAKRDLEFLQGGAQVDKKTGQVILTDEQEEMVRWREGKEGGRLPKGVIEIDNLTGADLVLQIKENKSMLGSKEAVAAEIEHAKVKLPGKKITDARGRDCWAYQVPHGDAKKCRYYQVRIMFSDSTGQIAVVDFATADGGFGGIYSAMDKAGFNNQKDDKAGSRLVEDAGFDKLVTRLSTEV